MREMKRLYLATTLSAVLFSGCASDHNARLIDSNKKVMDSLKSEKIIQNYYKKKSQIAEQKRFYINAKNQWVHTLMKKVAKKNHIPISKEFIPATDYRVSAKGKYSFGAFLDMIYKQTGINYIVEDGYIQVKNKNLIDAYFPSDGGCSVKGAERFTLSLKDAPLSRIFGYFVENKGYTVQYDLHSHDNIDTFSPINFSYRGCSVRDSLQRIAKATDLKIVYKKGKILEVRDYDTLRADVPSYYDLAFSSSSSKLGENGGGTGVKLTDRSSPSKEFKSILQTFMSDSGKAYVSGKGYIVVEDKPSSITRLKKIINKETSSQKSMDLDITIVQVELKDEYSSGVDWEKILKPAFSTVVDPDTDIATTVLSGYKAGAGITNTIGDNAFSLSHLSSNGKLSVLKLLGTYGKTKVVKEHHLATRSGTLATLKAVEIIPYVLETSQITNGVAETQKEAKSVESGIVINIKPTLQGDEVSMNVDVKVSEYLGDKEFSDGFKLPMLKTNSIQAPLTAKMGDTTLLTGITLRNDANDYTGLPNGNKAGDLSMLTGKNEDSVSRKEYLIFIKPSRRAR